VTPLMITLLVIAGIAILIAIGYMNHVVENTKLEKARTKVELNDRLRRCGELTETFPGQFMTPALKLLMTRLELNVCQRLLNLEKTSATTKARITELSALVAQGESIPVNNPPAPILNPRPVPQSRLSSPYERTSRSRAAKPCQRRSRWHDRFRSITPLFTLRTSNMRVFAAASNLFTRRGSPAPAASRSENCSRLTPTC